jgi:phage shock protein A
MPILEWFLFRVILYVALPLAVIVLAVGPARFGRGARKAWSWIWSGTLKPEDILASVVKQQQEHIAALKKALASAETTEADISKNHRESDSNATRLDTEAASLAARGDDLGAKAALYQRNLERLAAQSFQEQLGRQRQHITDARRRLYLLELQLRQYELGRNILLSQLAQAKTVEQQFEIAHRFDPFSAIANWQKAEGMVQEKTRTTQAVEQVALDTADMPLAVQPAQVDPIVLDAQLAELKGRLGKKST